LLFFESAAVIKRSKELETQPITVQNAETLLDIHLCLFQDIYHWTGQKRTVEISKQGKPFFLISYFDKGFAYIDTLVAGYRKIDHADKSQLARHLAELLDSINYLHPFREGNGRTQRKFIRVLALEKGYILNLNPPDNLDVYERYMSGTIESDIEKLTALILELMQNTLD
jgi:cell filamentation protein